MYYWCDRAMEWVGETPSTPHPHPRFLPFCPIFLLQTTSCSSKASKASKASNKSSNRNPAIDNILRSCCSPWGPFRPIGQGIIIETERDLRLFFDNISDPARKIRRRPESASCARAKTAMVNERFFSIFCFFLCNPTDVRPVHAQSGRVRARAGQGAAPVGEEVQSRGEAAHQGTAHLPRQGECGVATPSTPHPPNGGRRRFGSRFQVANSNSWVLFDDGSRDTTLRRTGSPMGGPRPQWRPFE